MGKLNFYTLFISIIFITGYLFGQDTLGAVKKDLSKIHWSGSLKAEGSYKKGNTNYIFGMSEGEIKRTDRLLETILSAKLTYVNQTGLKMKTKCTHL